MGRIEPIDNYAHRLIKIFDTSEKPAENLTAFRLFIRKEGNTGLSDETLKSYYSAFIVFSRWCSKPLNDLTELDILDFLDYLKACGYAATSMHSYKGVYKKFFNTQNKELAELFKERRPPTNSENKKRENLLTKEEVEKMINTANNYRDKAVIATLYESGARRGELLSCRIKDVIFDANGARITLKGKTGTRIVRLVFAASFLRDWITNHPCRDTKGKPDKEAFLCTSLHSKIITAPSGEQINFIERLANQGLDKQLKRIAKRCGVEKAVNPHAWRHARASDLAEHLTDQQLKRVMGWRPDSRMAAVYVHDVDTEMALLKLNGIEIEGTYTDGLKVGRCPRCKELNPETQGYCGKCGLPLKDATAAEIERGKQDLDMAVMQAIAANPDVLKELTESVARLQKKN
ncbi:tyrosine-type recombinase/integrase [Methanosarcina sp. UBA5]|uniref:tyrosine-type recombinase/integrase n=1 Tax=Methanosarcina sp. UBA5 TaxID=1915593 RepID=UPI0025FF2073|nr:tyrosine-type recombinase/integrase [Methanosarcina sp. UBA5]